MEISVLERRGKVIEQRVYSISGTDPEAEKLRKLANRVGGDLKKGRVKIRPLPRVAVELGKLAASSDPDLGAAIALVQRDANLAGAVLRGASAASLAGKPPTNVAEAAMKLGVSGMRDMAFAAALPGVFRCGALDAVVKEQVTHGFVVGVLTSELCKMMKICSSVGFLAGLFHDVGTLLVLAALASYGKESQDATLVARISDRIHTRVGPFILKQWEMDPHIVAAARSHDDDDAEGLTVVVQMADYIEKLGGTTAEDRMARMEESPCPYGPTLSQAHLEYLAKTAEAARNDPFIRSL